MKVKDNDKLKIVLGLALAVMVIVGVGFYFQFSSSSGHSPGELVSIAAAVVLTLAAVYYIWERKKDVDAGMPFEDELSKKVMHKAAYFAYFASMYTALGVSMFKENIEAIVGIAELTVSDVAGIVVLVPAIVFFIAIFYFKRRGDVE